MVVRATILGLLFHLAGLLSPIPTLAAELVKTKVGPLTITLTRADCEHSLCHQLLIQHTEKSIRVEQIETEVIDEPTRAVIDVKGVTIKEGAEHSIDDELINGLRVGVHTQLTRLVVDFDPTFSSTIILSKELTPKGVTLLMRTQGAPPPSRSLETRTAESNVSEFRKENFKDQHRTKTT